jgi:lycopene cyclase domain-containing protein
MTYFGILALFLLPPLVILLLWVPRDVWRWLFRRQERVNWEPYLFVLIHIALALLYTTPWDNYLVATGVWWYNPDLVTGLTIGWVPIEEYTFFVLQTAITGLWALAVQRHIVHQEPFDKPRPGVRLWSSAIVAFIWLASTVLFFSGWQAGTYLTLILSWALIPVLVQTVFGGDILLWSWRVLLLTILPPTLYLWLLDAVALSGGTWTIDPAQTTGWMVGVIPIEEMVFFLMTNVIIGFGMTLMCSPASKERANSWIKKLRSKRAGYSPSQG